MTPKRVADLFCGAGGAAKGLKDAWPDAEIVGFDIVDQPHYPYRFVKMNAFDVDLGDYDFAWASPSCQGYSSMTAIGGKQHLRLVDAMVWKLTWSGLPFVVENVTPRAFGGQSRPHMLCGAMFGLKVARHRFFVSNRDWIDPEHVQHAKDAMTILTKSSRAIGDMRGPSRVENGRKAMGIDWMTQFELGEAIPPAYSRWIASNL